MPSGGVWSLPPNSDMCRSTESRWTVSAWEAAEDEAECSFAPHINTRPDVPSTMGDFMRGWSEKRRSHLVDLKLEQQRAEQRQLAERPQQRTKAVTEALLRGASYSPPMKATKVNDPAAVLAPTTSERGAGSADAALPDKCETRGRTRWIDVVDRLYPRGKKPVVDDLGDTSQASQGEACSISCPGDTEGRAAKGVVPTSGSRCRTPGPAKTCTSNAATSPCLTTCGTPTPCSAQAALRVPISEKVLAPGLPGKRRLGRPPKATWEYLCALGTRQLRERSAPPPQDEASLKPLARSEKLLKAAEDGGAKRRPLWEARNDDSASVASSAPSVRSPGGPGNVVARRQASHAAELYDRGVRMRAVHDERVSVAAELRDAEEMRECTFQPNVHRRRSASQKAVEQNVTLSLYERGLQAKMRRQLLEQEGSHQLAEKEMRECTFRPAISGPNCSTTSEAFAAPTAAPAARARAADVSSATASARSQPSGQRMGGPNREAVANTNETSTGASAGWTDGGIAIRERSDVAGFSATGVSSTPADAHKSVMAMLEAWRGDASAPASRSSVAAPSERRLPPPETFLVLDPSSTNLFRKGSKKSSAMDCSENELDCTIPTLGNTSMDVEVAPCHDGNPCGGNGAAEDATDTVVRSLAWVAETSDTSRGASTSGAPTFADRLTVGSTCGASIDDKASGSASADLWGLTPRALPGEGCYDAKVRLLLEQWRARRQAEPPSGISFGGRAVATGEQHA
eukprot:TRINITY_DN38653_c0_g1_i1.p1 TRINITY_DN38653_c0_g1~~TRINITY_DN38653_c0_g1_i1.p1  ORF type:complete len:743 (+),score=137.79 TRINITY_DN38653_c0_g1_i1:290-2518(+)